MSKSKLNDLLAKAEARREAAKSALSEDDIKEIELRNRIAEIEAEAEAEERKARNLDLDRRLEAAREALGDKAGLEAVAIEGFKDTFVIQRQSKAHSKWAEDIAKAASPNSKLDRATVNRAYAVAAVYDWNGEIGGENPEFTVKLTKYLTDNPGIVTPINNASANLAGVFAQERKS
jgi:23S rRNA G2069 N7-methylase RlmK/C1962 C5-methylase RlmI